MPVHDTGAASALTTVLLGSALLLLLAAYLLLLARGRARGRGWPARRVVCAVAGVLSCLLGLHLSGRAGHHDLVSHMWGHLLLGMLGPLLLVLAAPVTAALRGLPVRAARRLSAVLRSRAAGLLSHPVIAALLNGGGLVLLYTTGLLGWAHSSTTGYALVHAHVLLAGWLFTASVLRVDPSGHVVGHGTRAGVLVGFAALHAVVAKHVYAHPPAGTTAAQAETAAQLMYYGGDAVDVTLLVLLGLDWYRRTAPRPRTVAVTGAV